MECKWATIPGYDSRYEASSDGKIRVIATGKVLGSYINDHGYAVVAVVKNGKHVIRKVHRLMMLAFYGEDPDRPICNHIDGNKLNNTLENLEWCTSSENNQHAYDTGLKNCDSIMRELHITMNDIDFIVLGADRAARKLHDLGKFADVSHYNLKSAINRCASQRKLYLGQLRVEYTDAPYDGIPAYNKCGVKGRMILAELPNGLILKAKGPANLADKFHMLGYFKDHERKALTKYISGCAMQGYSCYGIRVWFIESM